MAKIKIYTTMFCPYCDMAKELLQSKGAAFEEIDVTTAPDIRAEMARRTGRTSVPQIWIGATHVGGCDDLHALDGTGRLDELLAANT